MLNNLLIYRVMVLNLVIFCGVVWALANGYIQILFEGETTGIGYAMVLVAAVAFAAFLVRVWKTSKAMNDVKAGVWVDVRKFSIKSSFVGSVAVWLVTLGLIGNILGFSIAVESLDLTGGTDAALAAISGMIAGMKVAFYTTLIGTSLGLWLAVNGHILRVAIALLKIDSENSVTEA